MLWNKSAPWYDKIFFVVLCVMAAPSVLGLFSPVRPSRLWAEYSYIVAAVSIVLFAVYIGFNIYQERILQDIKSWKKRWLLFPFYIVFFGWFFWMAILNGIPAVAAKFSQATQHDSALIIKKSTPANHGWKNNCDYSIAIDYEISLLQSPMCISSSLWRDVQAGDTLEINGSGTWFGYTITNFLIRSTGDEKSRMEAMKDVAAHKKSSERLTLFIIIIFAGIPLTLLIVFFPIQLYNITWRSFIQSDPVIPLTKVGGGTSPGLTFYYRLSGFAPKIYGLICLMFGLSTQIFIIDFAFNTCASCYVTFSQKIELWIWLGCLFPLAFSLQWVPALSTNAERIFKLPQGQELFFWKGLARRVFKIR